MKVTDALLGEHGVLYALFDHVERELPGLATLEAVQQLGGGLRSALITHARIEDDLLFPILETRLGPDSPLAVMREEHELIEEALNDVASATDREVAVDRLEEALRIAREHFGTEEEILFHMAVQALSERELEQLGFRWADARRVALS